MISALALDLSLTATGLAATSHGGITVATIHTGTARGVPRQRLILNNIRDAVTRTKPAVVAIEGIYVGHNTNTLPLAELHGIVKFWLDPRVPYVLIPPSTLKLYATGKGVATKETVLLEAERRLGRILEQPIVDNDQADALWLLAAALDHYGAPLAPMPIAHRAALTKIGWPVLGQPTHTHAPPAGAAATATGRREPLSATPGR